MGGKTGIRSAKRQRVIDMLDAAPQGLHTKAIALALEANQSTVLNMLSTMAERGFVWRQREWLGETHTTHVRWCVGKHREAAMAASKLAGMADQGALSKEEKAAQNIVPPRTPIVVTDAPRVVDSSQCRPWAAAVGG